ncbi:MAG: cytochrome c5 family protein [Hahellaceae bacterium]|nr:cytochrome c5 family protein [Hahellaceae bacterium]
MWVQQSLALTPAEEKVVERIKPVAKVCVQGQECEGAQTAAVAAAPAGPRAGDEIYNGKCMACHATGAAGAPKVGDAAAWAPRIAQGIDTLVGHAINGFNAMPPRGTCADCSDDEIKATVEYMVGQSQ